MNPVAAARDLVLVTGAAGSIGVATVAAVLARGAAVVAADRQALPGHIAGLVSDELRVDLTDDEGTGAALRTVAEHGRLRHVIAIAGGGDAGELAEADPAVESLATFSRVVANNLLVAFTTIRHAVPLLRQSSGDRSITLVGSINAYGGYGAPGYSAAKAGLLGLVNSLAPVLGPDGIRVNCLTLGTVDTDNLRALAEARGVRLDLAAVAEQTPLHRVLTPDDVAAALVSMALDMGGLTGSNLVLDNGQLRSR